MEQRGQFTFYESFLSAILRIKKDADRAKAYDAICKYALYGTEPNLDNLPDAAATVFILAKPNLDSSREKALNGKHGGSKRKTEANGKQTESKPEANGKQEPEASEKEEENKKEKEIEIEYECKNTPAPEKHKYGVYGWVRLTEEEYNRLVSDLGKAEAERCIAYIDESAQGNGNKNKWKDWNLVVRKCSREGWGKNQPYKRSWVTASGEPQPVNLDALKQAWEEI